MSARASAATPWEANFREQLTALRKERGMSQERLARALKDCGLSFHQSAVSKIEKGDRPILLAEAYLIAEVLGVPIEAMTGNNAHVPDIIAALSRRVVELENAVATARCALNDVTNPGRATS